MNRDKFRVIVKGLITNNGDILIGKKEEDDDHSIGGEWHLLGGHVDKNEQPEEAMKREIEEETGLEVEVHQIIDVMNWTNREDAISVLYHCEALSRDFEIGDDLQDARWVNPSRVKEFVHDDEIDRLEERENQSKFLEKIDKSPF